MLTEVSEGWNVCARGVSVKVFFTCDSSSFETQTRQNLTLQRDEVGLRVESVAATEKSRPVSLLTISVSLSLLVHGALLAGLIHRSEKVSPEKPKSPEDEKTVTVSLVVTPQVTQSSVTAVEIPEPEPEEEPEPEKRKMGFVRTSADQAGPAEETNLLGEFETRASSEVAPTDGAEAKPAQDGEEARIPDSVETVTTDYNDGALTDNRTSAITSPSLPDVPSLENQEAEEAQEVQDSQEAREAIEAQEAREAVAKAAELREREAQLKLQDEALPKPTEKTEEREKVDEQEAKPPKKVSTPITDDPAFSGFAKKNKVIGSIGKNAKRSARNVRSTPLGKYEAAMSKAIEREWQLQATRYSDLIVPGVLSVTFFVDRSGKVFRIHFVKEIAGGSVQKGFTYRAIKSAKLPRMPQNVIDELNGDALEVNYNFGF